MPSRSSFSGRALEFGARSGPPPCPQDGVSEPHRCGRRPGRPLPKGAAPLSIPPLTWAGDTEPPARRSAGNLTSFSCHRPALPPSPGLLLLLFPCVSLGVPTGGGGYLWLRIACISVITTPNLMGAPQSPKMEGRLAVLLSVFSTNDPLPSWASDLQPDILVGSPTAWV